MRLVLVLMSLLWVANCGGDHYEGGGRRNELPEPSAAGMAGTFNIAPGDASSSQAGSGGGAGDSAQGGDAGLAHFPFGGSAGSSGSGGEGPR